MPLTIKSTQMQPAGGRVIHTVFLQSFGPKSARSKHRPGGCRGLNGRMRKRRGLPVWGKSGGRVGWLTDVCALVCGNKSNKS